ncbi:DNA polymerase ligase N-terminal domain-containing protein [Candidatus Sordicultor fermentans]|jgi:DNA ligase D-like protein (predicted 3'-phosphoesterase)|uniref:DNA polymerase ligase N-terminal domain-containing protein n=1 Tax=Candidatus Sordicultor fermentans TaxID=1953203 RepID=UPI0016932B47|nr:DNA polymerase ligase N-terminal domain-containing protein [Atribacterota bacterium]NLY04630.1 3'-phosphoesterase [Candidatus Atribacteria bacterium]HOA98549.1 DNA polymerase ligase N-terminal domain-containing protein [Candidatus Atribacteria bacterium]HOQ51898.1 DNA polymerase ligase N-terminal domain-containing protein [Candidatus Atribacteria bacterium]HPZ39366.1 DNA polymerase ligase N-terminal domain-containing protein [Candidatus Atribacteria bacterium]
MEEKIFVIQEHWASRHHFDFRLEKDGVLKSWAIPRSIPQNAGEKRLAIEVEDHDLDYADFEGEITEGYGKGKVKIWDRGYYLADKWEEDEILLELKGNKVKGKYALIRTKGSKADDNRQWLLIKRKEDVS